MKHQESDFPPIFVALIFSVVVHAVLLAIHFNLPKKVTAAFEDSPLEVILVNAKSQKEPSKALALAQFNLNGGGENHSGRATSPLMSSDVSLAGDSLDQSQSSQIKSMQQEQNLLLDNLRKQIAALPPPSPMPNETAAQQEQREKKKRALLKLLAEIEMQVHKENIRPKRRFISPSTREVVYANYYDTMRRSIEAQGTLHFPEVDGIKIYGELTMVITIDAKGRLIQTEVVRPSGVPHLDGFAEAIVRATMPLEPFTAAMKAQADQIVVVTRFKFGRDNTVQTRALNGEGQRVGSV